MIPDATGSHQECKILMWSMGGGQAGARVLDIGLRNDGAWFQPRNCDLIIPWLNLGIVILN